MLFNLPLRAKKLSFRGFSLIEVMVVLLLISVIAALTVPNFRKAQEKFILKEAVDELATLMRYAHSRAIIKNQLIRLNFFSDNSGYQLTQSAADTEQDTDAVEPIPGRFGRVHAINPELTVETEQTPIVFYPDGKIDKVHIVICREETCYTVSTKEQQGFVRVLENRYNE